MPAIKIVVVDDEWDIIKPLLAGNGWSGFAFSGVSQFSVEAVLQEIGRVNPSVLLLDIMHAGHEQAGQEASGIRLFNALGENEKWKALRGSVQVVFFSAEPSVRRHALVGRAKRVDVSGFVSKHDLLQEKKPEALGILRQAANLATIYAQSPELADPALRTLCDLVFSPNSQAMHDVWRQIVLAGRCHEPVFISGETGAGKELVANAVFEVCRAISNRRKDNKRAPGSCGFLPLNIAALPAEGNLQYIELFGAEPESYSGISKPRKGLFELADEAGAVPNSSAPSPGGTIFLDEIGDAAPVVQVALLRVLQERTITPLGGFNSSKANKKISFRLISASHSLLKNVENKLFREDLYYRLNGIHIHMPPLRERKDDIGVLVAIFIDKLNKEYGEFGWEPKDMGDVEKLVKKLGSYHWQGNVRELEMAIRSSFVTTIGTTFQLSDEVERRLVGREPTPRADVEQLLESLRQKPIPLTQVAKESGTQVAVQVYQALTGGGRHLDSITAKQYFGQNATPEALHKWVTRQLQPKNSSKNQEEQDV